MRQTENSDQWQHREDNFSRKPGRRENDEFMAGPEHVKACPNCGWPVTSWPCICGYGGKPAREPSKESRQRKQQASFEWSGTASSRETADQRAVLAHYAAANAEQCTCPHTLGSHDVFCGPCMEPACRCKAFTLRDTSEAA